MGRIDYQVLVSPHATSSLAMGPNSKIKTIADLTDLVNEIRSEWKSVTYDSNVKPDNDRAIPLVYETDKELFQILVIKRFQVDEIYISMRFAYYNPPSIYGHFCGFIAWLMTRYDMYCSPMRPLVSSVNGEILGPYAISDVNQIDSVLIPSMEYMHRLWRNFAGNEAVKLSPEAATIYLRDHYHPQVIKPDPNA